MGISHLAETSRAVSVRRYIQKLPIFGPVELVTLKAQSHLLQSC
jgi:hypothetical protein